MAAVRPARMATMTVPWVADMPTVTLLPALNAHSQDVIRHARSFGNERDINVHS
jgi:hypothetical protein